MILLGIVRMDDNYICWSAPCNVSLCSRIWQKIILLWCSCSLDGTRLLIIVIYLHNVCLLAAMGLSWITQNLSSRFQMKGRIPDIKFQNQNVLFHIIYILIILLFPCIKHDEPIHAAALSNQLLVLANNSKMQASLTRKFTLLKLYWGCCFLNHRQKKQCTR